MKSFLFFAMFCCMMIGCEYGITRPASNAIFLTVFSAKAYPWVWLATVPLNLLVVYLYTRFLPKIGPLKMMGIVGTFSIGVNTLCSLALSSYPELIFFQYAWKDIYILIMYKQFWSMIHSTVAFSRAKYLYGLIFGMGTIGSIFGSFIPGFFAVELGSETLLLFTLPVYSLLLFSYWMAYRKSGVSGVEFQRDLTPNPKAGEALALIRRSPFLTSVLCLVIAMQISVGLVEYLFNTHLELNILDQDLRTEYYGRIVGLTNMLSGIFQFVGGFVLIHFVGMKRSHFLIPFILALSGLFSWALPTFAIVSFSFLFVKSIDFSLFGVLREMLYVPLKLDEKYRAKAIIDIFAHRTSKALVSLCVLALQALAGAALLPSVNALSIAVFIAWM
ncbi:MAG TPA: Npt1/Npt2 family nucleotide transporter, partial [Chlamydiales bacterium]|nr:Npt1/Npt2 family nucleotide transporter [Chlamydiales bacterium]